MKKQKDSSAIQLLRLVWGNCNESTAFAYERLNHAMYHTLQIAIGSGFGFDIDDFKFIGREFRIGFWGCADSGGFAESFYSLAAVVGNISACQAFEAYKNRKPIIADDVNYNNRNGTWMHGGGGSRANGRLCVGCTFDWRGEEVEVTSMADGKSQAVACSYKGSRSDYNRKILHRYTITPEAIIADRAERKERDAIRKRAEALVAVGWNASDVCRRLGLKAVTKPDELKREFAIVSMAKLRKAIEKMEREQAAKAA